MDVILNVRALPAGGETVLGDDPVLAPGGKGANQAVAASLAGAHVAIAGALGDDAHARALRDALDAANVDLTHLRTTTQRSTGLAVLLVAPDGENAIAVASGANHSLVPADVDELLAEVRRADVLLMQMELPVDVVARAAEVAAEVGTCTVLNLAPVVDFPAALLERLDVLVVNRSEAARLLRKDLPDVAALSRAVEELRSLGPAAAVVTAGGEGAFFGDGHEPVHLPAVPVEVVDTTGAGDAFVGVLAAELSRGGTLRDAVSLAAEAGAAAVQVRGAQLTTLVLSTRHDEIGSDVDARHS
jgi:ribokinase